MMYVKVIEGVAVPYTTGQLAEDNPKVSFPRSFPDEVLARYDVYPLTVTDGADKVADGYEEVSGQWQTRWRDKTQQELDDELASWRATARVPALAARLTLIGAGHWDNLQALVDAIPDATERATTQAWLAQATHWKRSSPRVASLAGGLGLSDTDIDALFRTAAAMDLD